MSKAKDQFEESIKDAEELLSHHDKVTGGKKAAPPKEAEVLKRAGLILGLTAWETYVEDRAREAMESQLVGIKGGPIADFVGRKFNEEMKRFHTPKTANVRKLFQDFAGKDVTAAWTTWGGNAAKAQTRLDNLVSLRGQAAHRSRVAGKKGIAPHLLSRNELDAAIKFLKELVRITEDEL